MDFAPRARDEVALATTVRVVLTETGVALTVDVEGAAVDWALELAFRPGGTMSGARALGRAAAGSSTPFSGFGGRGHRLLSS